MLYVALVLNLILVVCEVYTLFNIKRKVDIFKYYTYLQNFLALIVSVIFCGFIVYNLISGNTIPGTIKGLRYVACCGLIVTMLVFIFFLGGGKKLSITEEDFLPGITPKWANFILHYLCPILSTLSLVVFERGVVVDSGIWTLLVAIPSCVYWVVYGILTASQAWKEPYNFSNSNQSKFLNIVTIISIPLLFILVTFLIWNIM